MQVGAVKNILEDTEFPLFAKGYPNFHRKLMKKIEEKPLFCDYLESALAFL